MPRTIRARGKELGQIKHKRFTSKTQSEILGNKFCVLKTENGTNPQTHGLLFQIRAGSG